MSPLQKELKDIIRCPRCKGEVEEERDGRKLFCNKCQLSYPIRDNIPYMVVNEAIPSGKSVHHEDIRHLVFRVTSGPDSDLTFQLDSKTCRALGRSADDFQKTSVFNLDLKLTLDEGTKALILRYISRQFGENELAQGTFGGFKRVGDIILTDSTLSKLHAMFFASSDKVGVLDLVSKNGTFVNGQEVESCILRPGDVIEVGDTKILFEG